MKLISIPSVNIINAAQQRSYNVSEKRKLSPTQFNAARRYLTSDENSIRTHTYIRI